MIRLEAVTKRWPNGHVAVNEIDLVVPTGEVCALVGPSGSGKTTTMKMINRLVEPTSGRIFIDDVEVHTVDAVVLRRGIGYVIQQVGLFPHQTVAANVGTVARLLGWDKRRTATRVEELLVLVGLDPATFAHRYPHQLSGGQRQRVGVARALCADPPVLLMDEPFGAIDPITRARLQEEFRNLQATLRKTVVFVTHDIDEAVLLGDRVAVLAEGGHLAQVDTPDRLLAAPADAFVADFVGAERGLRRLRVLPIERRHVVPVDGFDPGQLRSVALGAPLEDALAALLLDDAPAVAILDGGAVIGVLTPDALHAAARAAG
ncbi:MAG TPA: ATP-binding cassette domain-containing protein [Acidimicrobiales bacterium]|nr:ATP-binding cassette domain-containing protein [Acidimicrobiales bacterium]